MIGLVFANVPTAKAGLRLMLLDTGSLESYRLGTNEESLPSPFRSSTIKRLPPEYSALGENLALAKIDFIVGLDQLKGRPILVRGAELRFGQAEPPPEWTRLKVYSSRGRPYIQISISGKVHNFLFDSGCSFPVTFHSLKSELPIFLPPMSMAFSSEHRFERIGVATARVGKTSFPLASYIDEPTSQAMENWGMDGVISPTYFSSSFYLDLRRGIFKFDPSTQSQSILNTVIGAVTGESFSRGRSVALDSSIISLLTVGYVTANQLRKLPLSTGEDVAILFDKIMEGNPGTYRYAEDDGTIVTEKLLSSRSPTIKDNFFQIQFPSENLVREGIRRPGIHVYPRGTKVIIPSGSRVKVVIDEKSGSVSVTVP